MSKLRLDKINFDDDDFLVEVANDVRIEKKKSTKTLQENLEMQKELQQEVQKAKKITEEADLIINRAKDVAQKLSPAIDLAKQISKEQAEKKINEEIKMSTNLTGAILKFADTEQDDKEQCLNTWNEIFAELKSKYIIMHEGDLLRVFNSAIDLLRTVTEVSDDPILVQKASLAIDYLKKPPVTDILKYELDI